MIIRVHGFGKDDPMDSKVDPNAHLALRQNVPMLTGSGRVVVMGYNDKSSTNATTLTDDMAPVIFLPCSQNLTLKSSSKWTP
jgi:hypothetical protein